MGVKTEKEKYKNIMQPRKKKAFKNYEVLIQIMSSLFSHLSTREASREVS